MQIRCRKCGRKFDAETDDRGIPKRDICDRCRAKELEKELRKNADAQRSR